jgi:amidase
MNDYTDHDATALADLVRRGEITPAELLDDALAALERVEPTLHGTVHRLDERARKQVAGELPDGPFRGVPFVIKDMDGFLAGEPCSMGCRFLAGFVPSETAEVLRRLERAGLVFIAKTNCPELGLLGTTEPELHGPTHNPWAVDHSPGGSSGGTAALVAARVVPMGHGGDGGGSLRIPASMCGLFGFKATRGRVPAGPGAGEYWGGFATAGVITRSVRDSAAILDAIAGPEPGAPYCAPPAARPFRDEVRAPVGRLRVAFTAGSLYGKAIDRECQAAVTDAAKLLEDLGHDVVEATPPIDREKLTRAYLVQMGASVARDMESFAAWMGRDPDPDGFEPLTWMIGQLGRGLSAVDLERSRHAMHEAGRVMAKFHERYDVLLCSPLGVPPPRTGDWALRRAELLQLAVVRRVPVRPILNGVLDGFADRGFEMVPNTMLFNQTGQPAMSVPLHWSPKALPIGVQVSAAFGNDAVLFRLAAQLEEARPWADRRPPVCA